MSIFNSLGSNYTFVSAMRIVCSTGGAATQKKLSEYLETRYGGKAILTYKGREAIQLALTALPEKGAVAIPGFTCLAVYEAVIASGNTVHYLDITDTELNFSPETLRLALDSNPAIKAVLVQNTLGFPCDIRAISELCKARGIVLIEDLAHSIGARYESGEDAGTVGDFVILSFSQDKVVDAVSGGALIIRNPKYADKIGLPTGQLGFFQQLKDRLYPILTWKIRFSYRFGLGKIVHRVYRSLGILSAPFGADSTQIHMLPGWYCANILQQYRSLERIENHRRAIAEIYAEYLDKTLQLRLNIKNAANLRFPIVVQGRDRLINFLRERDVHVSDIWYDAPIAPKKYMHRTNYAGECPISEDISNRILNLPTHCNVSRAHARAIAEAIDAWRESDTDTSYEITSPDKDAWEEFLGRQKSHSFLQSWAWGEYCQQTGSKIFRIGMSKGEELVAIALFTLVEARRGSFLLCPHGPVIPETEDSELLLRALARECTRIAHAEKSDFIRFCPLSAASPKNRILYRELGFRDAPIHMHPELSWMLDITKSEDDLLREMRKTTRYLVKKMEKEGVEITMSGDPADIEKFWPVYQATVERQHFTPFSKNTIKKEFELFAENGHAAFFFGSYQSEIIAAAIIIFYNGQAFYHHSGSIQRSKDINASYLLQWRVIQEAKKRGCTLYNFWGISPADKPQHPWAGLSLFKKGFGGFAEEYLHAQDKPLTAKYAISYMIETARRIKRGL
jgi:dTDP-4-amino-4,6-dideoxygalactose transaminase/lipid II:glycine glycyltransferase (peptidoglycan interpeptide bridge formation enzyme)